MVSMWLLGAALSFATTFGQWQSDYELFPVASNLLHQNIIVEAMRRETSTSTWWSPTFVTAHIATTRSPLRDFVVIPPAGGCGNLSTPLMSAFAAGVKCQIVSNGGFFDPDNAPHSCLGAAFRHGQPLTRVDQLPRVATFSTVRSRGGSGYFVVGYVNETDLGRFRVESLITGQGWLVRNGKVNLREALRVENWTIQRSGSAHYFADLKAPRLAVGHDVTGNLLLVAADGDAGLREGATLAEFAEFLANLGLINAINLDGGGSVSFAQNDVVVNVPSDTCNSNAGHGRVKCVRKVSTAICLGRNLLSQGITISRSRSKSLSSSSFFSRSCSRNSTTTVSLSTTLTPKSIDIITVIEGTVLTVLSITAGVLAVVVRECDCRRRTRRYQSVNL